MDLQKSTRRALVHIGEQVNDDGWPGQTARPKGAYRTMSPCLAGPLFHTTRKESRASC